METRILKNWEIENIEDLIEVFRRIDLALHTKKNNWF